MFDAAALDAQSEIGRIQGHDRLWFAGAWQGYGFHEDGLRSGLDVARELGVVDPWSSSIAASSGSTLPERAVAQPH